MEKEDLKKIITMQNVLDRYGIVPTRGMISCPKHKDKTPSMKIYKDGFRCFSCLWSGDIFDFVMYMDSLSFKEAFLALGGTYEHEDKAEVRRKIEQAERRRLEKESREAERKRQRNAAARYISALRNGIECFPVFSDEWCFCQNELPMWLYRYDILSGLEVIK